MCVYWNYRAFVLDGCLIEAQIYSCQCNGSWTMMSKRKRGFEKNVKPKNKYEFFFLVSKNYQRGWVCNAFVDGVCYWFSNMKWRYLSFSYSNMRANRTHHKKEGRFQYHQMYHNCCRKMKSKYIQSYALVHINRIYSVQPTIKNEYNSSFAFQII